MFISDDENMMIKMLYESVYYPNESSDYYRKSKSLNVDLKSGSINDELVNFDANMRKLLNPFVLIFFDKDQDFILEQLKVCANENLKNVCNCLPATSLTLSIFSTNY